MWSIRFLSDISVPSAPYGWSEIGQNDDSHSFFRALDIGGAIWKGKPKYKSVDAALDDLEAAFKNIIEEIG